MDYAKEALKMHEKWRGKITVEVKAPLETKDDLSIAYTPGVAEPCLKIAEDKDKSYLYTARSNMVAVITDGSAVLGLGNIGSYAAMPVMEGKCALFKRFAGVNAFPICLDTQDTEEIIATVKAIAPSFGGINLEDIAAPRCFEIEERLDRELDIPVFHDDQHGTAIVALAAMINCLKLTKKQPKNLKVVLSGAGAAGTALAKLFLAYGVGDVLVCNRKGIISKNNEGNSGNVKVIADITNKNGVIGNLETAMKGADFFFGVSAPALVTSDMVKSMSDKACVFAMANPVPEIYPDDAIQAGAFIAGSGRSDFDNQINNVLAFPGIFAGALKARASTVTFDMKIAAAEALADFVKDPSPKKVVPSPFDEGLGEAVANAVEKAAKK